jgi:serine/threonine protein phosphatase PrpC
MTSDSSFRREHSRVWQKVSMRGKMVVESAGTTHIGMKRVGNEDALLLDDGLGLYVVADGMGGHLAGEVASRVAAESLHAHMKRLVEGDQAAGSRAYDRKLSHEANHLVWGIREANLEVYRLSMTDTSYHGMGSTVSAVYIVGSSGRLVAANVGDSPVWLVHDGKIETLSVPHTVIADRLKLDPLLSDSFVQEYANVLTRAVGVGETVEPDVCELQCFGGDILVICSDGLSNKVTTAEVLEIVTGSSSCDACRKLVSLANDRGGDDNITVAVIKLKGLSNDKSRVGRALSWIKSKVKSS